VNFEVFMGEPDMLALWNDLLQGGKKEQLSGDEIEFFDKWSKSVKLLSLPPSQGATDIRSNSMLLIIAVLVLLLWGGGFAFHIAGGLIHLLLVIALVLIVLNFIGGRSGV